MEKICQTRKCLHITADLLQSMVVCMHTTAMPSVLSWMRNIFIESMDETFSSEPFLITSVPHPDGIRREGFPLDCLSVDLTTGKYYYDLDPAELGKVAAEDGSRRFFEKITGIFPHNML